MIYQEHAQSRPGSMVADPWLAVFLFFLADSQPSPLDFHWPVAIFLVCLFFLLLACAGFVYERIGEGMDLRREPAPGGMIRTGKHRLHLLSKGQGGPTVIIEQGAGGLARFWWKLQDEIAAFSRVCSYDRAGYGWSEAAAGKRSIEQRVEDLRALLQNGSVPAPYLFVAHSYGGFIVRGYAEAHPGEVAGLVLVDTPEESSVFNPGVLDFYAKMYWINRVFAVCASLGVLRFLRHWIPLHRYGIWLSRPSEFHALCDDLLSLQSCPESHRSSREAGSLGNLPIIAISHGKSFPGPFAVLETNWLKGQRRPVALCSFNKSGQKGTLPGGCKGGERGAAPRAAKTKCARTRRFEWWRVRAICRRIWGSG